MKKNIIKLSMLSVATASLLVGCGSSSSSNSTSDDTNTGYFIDSAVQNAHYETTSGLSGDTDKYGRFKYKVGDTVKFSLGKIILGETQPATDGKITPKTLISGNETPNTTDAKTITLMLQMLQSLDSDNNTSNGITIDEDVISELENLSLEHHIKDLDEETLLSLNNTLDSALDEDYDGHIDVDETEAKNHFDKSLKEYENGHKPDEDNKKGKGSTNTDHSSDSKGKQNGKSNNAGSHNNSQEHDGNEFNISTLPITANLSDEVKNSLAYMGNEERLAYDVYNYLYNYQLTNNSNDIKQLSNIASKSEIKHIGIVKDLVTRYNIDGTQLSITDVNTSTLTQDSNLSVVAGVYDIQKVQDLYNALITLGQSDKISALKVGCMVEVTDINDLDEYVSQAEDSNATDVIEAFNVLRDGSYKHYWAFDKGLKNEGITNGCYFENDTLLTNKEGIYPQD